MRHLLGFTIKIIIFRNAYFSSKIGLRTSVRNLLKSSSSLAISYEAVSEASLTRAFASFLERARRPSTKSSKLISEGD